MRRIDRRVGPIDSEPTRRPATSPLRFPAFAHALAEKRRERTRPVTISARHQRLSRFPAVRLCRPSLECRNRTGAASLWTGALPLSQFQVVVGCVAKTLGTHRAMGSVSEPDGTRSRTMERRTPPNPRRTGFIPPPPRRMLVAARFIFFRTTKKPCSLTDQGLVVFPGRLVSPRRLPGHVRKVSAGSLPRYPRGGCHSPRTAAAQPVAAPVGALCNVLLVWKSCIPPARGSAIRQGRAIIDSNRQVSTGFREIDSGV